MLKITLLTLVAGVVLASSGAAAAPTSVYPAKADGFTQSLNGDWSFKYIPALDAGADADFHQPDFDVSAWKTVPVPANWELHGFAKPHYALELKDGLGLYRQTFRVLADWSEQGRRVFLRFKGVAYGFAAWVNSTQVGESTASAYNPHTFEVTDSLKSGGENLLAVQVTTKPHGFEFDINDDWSLGGMKLSWSLQRNRESLQEGEIPLTTTASQQETIRIPATIPADAAGDVLALNVRCLDAAGEQIYERVVRLDLPEARRTGWPSALKSSGAAKVTEGSEAVKIEHPKWTLTVERSTGELKLTDPNGDVRISGLYPMRAGG